MSKAEEGSLRIIGGCWRGRQLPVPAQPGLRPTTDRIRETLFNWLAPLIAGCRCLDCFAGSGALGLEAASRGAAEVVMIERSGAVARRLVSHLGRLGADQVSVHHRDALQWLAEAPVEPFDICFLDPPFRSGLLTPALEVLAARGWVAGDGLVYLEVDKAAGWPPLPDSWEWFRQKQAGQVDYGLARAATDRPQREFGMLRGF
ncbi:16S rRNA (guanine(966)-N(2))-methyltransferase RsmD [Halochromatium glycolicum]|uniref:Ribosomal RNA small subunit methyltransferase D n=1 Tax=Halochromatium glycolicum TaxID=85075 RepID=A0AAJ0XBU3_9GAMM|nr:16S rRNA (guanine(966)-N(2))-methyltransferase RsmD [Halochromatium glycolicum]